MNTLFDLELFLNTGSNPCEAITAAPWLHSDYLAPVWIIGRRGQKVRWNRTLPNGSLLTSARYSRLLTASRRVLFNSRTSVFVTPVDDGMHIRISHFLFYLIDWLTFQEDVYRPSIHAFGSLDRNSIADFIVQFAHGGASSVRFVIPRLLHHFDGICGDVMMRSHLSRELSSIPQTVFRRNTDGDVRYDFSDENNDLIRAWFYTHGFYERKSYGNERDTIVAGFLNRYKLGTLLGISKFHSGPRVDMFLRQFEFVNSYERLSMAIRYPHRERPACSYAPIEHRAQQRMARPTILALNTLLNNFQIMTPYVDGLPGVSEAEVRLGQVLSEQDLAPPKQTRSIPVHIALHIINSAAQYIHTYGDALVSLLADWIREYRAISDRSPISDPSKIRELAFQRISQRPVLNPLNIRVLRGHSVETAPRNAVGGNAWVDIARSCLSFEDALTLLIISVYILASIMAARRRGEAVGLSLECLKGSVGAYELEFELEKTSVEGTRLIIRRPVPNIVGKGINQVRSITTLCSQVFQDTSSVNLFNFPLNFTHMQPLAYGTVQHRLDMFCDYFQVPLDAEGRRWYVLPHEFRRFFAIVFFWQYKFSDLPALQWMLGPAKPEDTYAYVRSVVGAREMSRAEAQVSREALLDGSSTLALDSLRDLAMRHFHTADIRMIAQTELDSFLEHLISENVLKVRPHAIECDLGVRYELVFEVHK